MKGNKILFGLFAGLSLIFTANVFAQVNTGNGLIEIGPDNVAGRVTSIVIDQSDNTHQTIYAGAATGGLFVRSNDTRRAPYANMWNRVKCVVDGEEVSLPVSHMIQGPDNTIYIATGEGCFNKSDKFSTMSMLGRGIFRFNPVTGELSRIPNTEPSDINHPFASVNKLACLTYNGVLYFYAATSQGLYRWTVSSEADWSNTPVCYQPNYPIYDVVPIQASKMVYFSSFGSLYRISDVSSSSTPVDIYNSMPSTDVPCIVRLAVATKSDNTTYVYAMRIRNNGLLDGLYLTTNHSTWTQLTPTSVQPFTVTPGFECGALCVDPDDADRIYIAGSSIYSGKGFLPGQLYTWIKNSYNEYEFGSSNYMSDIFSSYGFVHSGINQIVCARQEGYDNPVYYIATDGGVFVSYNEMSTFGNINKGLNNVEVNGLAVATDGSLLIGANKNANIFVESRMAHNGGTGIASWYDTHPETNTNHHGNVIWGGNGGQVAVSRFQQYSPLVRRNIFTSSDRLGYGRASNDYADYSNTQTWTTGLGFLSSLVATPYTVPQMAFWEGDNVTTSSDTIFTEIDTLAYATRHASTGDTLIPLRPGTEILAGDEITVFSRNNSYYPVVYTVPEDFTVQAGDVLRVKNPIRSNLFTVGKKVGSNSTMLEIYMTWMPSDFRKVWYEHTSSTEESEAEKSEKMQWAKIYAYNITSSDYSVGGMAVSNDGNSLYIAFNNRSQNQSFIFRVSGLLTNIDYAGTITDIKSSLTYGAVNWSLDTMSISGPTRFSRCISSIAVDPREGTDHIIATFQGYGAGSNVVDIRNASTASPVVTYKTVAGNIPAFSALVELTGGDVYVGTDDGVWVATASSYASASTSWQRHGSLAGVPVTAICQQTHVMPVVHAINHVGINVENYTFARTKYPYAIYFGTYGRGVFMDSTYVVDHTNEIVDPSDYLGINDVIAGNIGHIKLYPNPASDRVRLQFTLPTSASVVVRIYDINGKQVMADNLGYRAEGALTHTVNCSSLSRGVYLVHVTTAQGSAASKLVIR
ncbi:MAG: hypothetical protein AUK63_329 [bacterium P3]|nr:MAG: hypothetical protein AUK63_329 [bacterium P3]KWW42711.1 MAG: hypothetical protein F083_115 [bacterium F083]